MANEKILMVRSAMVVPILLLVAAIWLGCARSAWWFLAIPFIAVGWLGAVPNLNCANGILAYLSMIVGLVVMRFHEPSGAAILGGAASGFYLSAIEMRITAQPFRSTRETHADEQVSADETGVSADETGKRSESIDSSD